MRPWHHINLVLEMIRPKIRHMTRIEIRMESMGAPQDKPSVPRKEETAQMRSVSRVPGAAYAECRLHGCRLVQEQVEYKPGHNVIVWRCPDSGMVV
jgi:hypothetical protein